MVALLPATTFSTSWGISVRLGRLNREMISRCLRGEQKHHRGYRWKVATTEQHG
ncbi:hypothetical protein ACET89_10500 [Aeromonas veronii]